jgi:Ca-activated chloride channel family protein
MTSQSFISRAAPLAAFLLALVAVSSPINITVSFTVVAQQEGPKKRTEDSGAEQRSSGNDLTVRIETRLVNLNVKAVDAAGRPVTDLKSDDFEVYEDGVKQQITHFSAVTAPVNVVLLLDLGGATKKRRQLARDAAAGFIDALPAQDKIALGAFTSSLRMFTDFTSDRHGLKDLATGLNPLEGGRAYYDAMLMAFEKIGSDSGHRKAMVVVTDGVDDSLAGGRGVDSGEDASPNVAAGELLGRAYDSDVTVYTIYLGASRRGGSFDRFFSGYFPQKSNNRALAYERLESLADETGGEIFGVSHEEDLLEAYQRVASSLHVLYSLAYSPDKLKHDGEFRKVNVKIRREGAAAKTRRGYYDK